MKKGHGTPLILIVILILILILIVILTSFLDVLCLAMWQGHGTSLPYPHLYSQPYPWCAVTGHAAGLWNPREDASVEESGGIQRAGQGLVWRAIFHPSHQLSGIHFRCR